MPAAVLAADRGAARRALRDRRGRPLPAGRRRQPGRALDQLGRGRGVRRARRAATSDVLHVAGRRDYAELRERLDGRAASGALHAARVRARPRRRARRLRPGPRPLRRLGLRGRRGRAAGDPGPLSARDRRPPDAPTPQWMERAGAATIDRRRRARRRQRLRRRGRRRSSATRRGWRTMAAASRGAGASRDAARTIADAGPAQAAASRGAVDAMSDWSGRRLHFIGIGGAGMSGLALVCAAARRRGHRQRPRESSYMERLRAAGLEPRDRPRRRATCRRAPRWSSRPRSPTTTRSWRSPASAASRVDPPRRAAGRALRREAADRDRRHPRQDDDDRDGGLGAARRSAPTRPSSSAARCPGSARTARAANAGWGEGEWVVAEADESDGSFLRLDPEIAVITNVEMDHHSRWGSLAELRRGLRRFRGTARVAVCRRRADGGARGGSRRAGARSVELRRRRARTGRARARRPRAPQRAERPRRLAALALAGLDLEAARRGARRLPRGRAGGSSSRASGGGARIYDDYAHHPTEVRAALSALRELEPARGSSPSSSPTSTRGPRPSPTEFGAALALADEVVGARRLPGPRGAGRRARRGQRPRRRPRRRRRGRAAGRSGWLPDAAKAAACLAGRWRLGPAGDVLVTIGAGDVFKLGEAPACDGGVDERRRRRRRARLPAGAPDHGPHRRPRRLLRPPRVRARSWSSCWPGRRSEASR